MIKPNDFGKKEVVNKIEAKYNWEKQVSYGNVCKYGTSFTTRTGGLNFSDSNTSRD